MLIEAALLALSLPGAPPSAWRHLPEAVGLWSRGRRQHAAWSPHLRLTARLIQRRLLSLRTCRTAVVLGSGPLLDVPLEALSARFERLLLVDRAHLLPARKAARRLPNVQLLWRDLSAATHPDPLGFLHDIEGLDLVVSVNLLSQLAVGAPDGQERQVIDSHLETLSALPAPVTLVTDFAYAEIDRLGRVANRVDLMYGRTLPPAQDRWTWEVAPFGEESADLRRVHAVCFYPDWRIARQPLSQKAQKPFIAGREHTRLRAGAVP